MADELWASHEEDYLRTRGWTQAITYWLHPRITGGLTRDEAVKQQRRWEVEEDKGVRNDH